MDMSVVNELISQNRYSDAIALLEAVPSLEKNVVLWVQLGRCHAAVGAWGKAIETLKHAHNLDPSNPDVPQRLFNASISAGLPREAQSFHDLCRNARIPEWRLLAQTAELLICRGKMDKARGAWTEATARCPVPDERRDVCWRVMDTLVRNGHPKEALEIMPGSGVVGEDALMVKAAAYSRLGMKKDLVAVVDEAMTAGYSFPNWARYKAQRACILGDFEGGAEILERHVTENPGGATHLAMPAECLQRAGKPDRAVEYARQARRTKPYTAYDADIVVRVLRANHL
jgi:tetratricopeptide (TPR) repeat protein